jgi:hypothetical protein
VKAGALVALLLLAACAAPDPYRPSSGGVGFSETRLAEDRWRVRYVGPTGMDEGEARRLALIRAAEVTLAAGLGHFRVVSTDTRVEVDRMWWDGYPRLGGSWGSGSGLALGVGFGTGYGRVTRRSTTEIEIVAFAGPKPPGDGVAYDAATLATEAPRR